MDRQLFDSDDSLRLYTTANSHMTALGERIATAWPRDKKSLTALEGRVRTELDRFRGRSLAPFLNEDVFRAFIGQFLDDCREPALAAAAEIAAETGAAVWKIAELKVGRRPVLRAELQGLSDALVERLAGEARAAVLLTLEREREIQYTQNHYLCARHPQSQRQAAQPHCRLSVPCTPVPLLTHSRPSPVRQRLVPL